MNTWSALPYFLALGATLCFSTSSLVFEHYSRRVSVMWMNAFKAFVALALLTVTLPLFISLTGSLSDWRPMPVAAVPPLLISGFLGLGIGDLFLLDAFTRIGVSRTLILYGFQPIILGLGGHFFFAQHFDPNQLIAVVFLIGCLVVFSLERYRETKSWEFRGLVNALIGVSLDSTGVLLTRDAFERAADRATATAQAGLSLPYEGHFVRCVGALAAYALIAIAIHTRRRVLRSKDQTPVIGLFTHFFRFDRKTRWILLLGCFAGTYLSLCLYLTAVRIGHLASLSAIAITGPMFAALLEALIKKKRPSRYLATAFAFFIFGFLLLL